MGAGTCAIPVHQHIVRHPFDKVKQLSDDVDHEALYRIAEAQGGYFTTQQAEEAGRARSTLSHHARQGGP